MELASLGSWRKTEGFTTLGEITIFAFNDDKLHEIYYRTEIANSEISYASEARVRT